MRTDYMWPCSADIQVTQEFGARPGGNNPAGGHTGRDFATPMRTPIFAAGDGIIEHAMQDDYTPNDNYLLMMGSLSIGLNCGDQEPTFTYGHLDQLLVKVGDRVTKGQQIALSGNSGVSEGPHCHFESLLPGFNLNNGTYGRSDPRLVCSVYPGESSGAWSPNTRLVTVDGANVRTAPFRDAPLAPGYPEGIAYGSTIVVVGYVKGEDPYDDGVVDDAWYKTRSGFYIWANAAGNDINGLEYLGEFSRPPAVTPTPNQTSVSAWQRVTGPDGARLRDAPHKNAALVKEFDADLVLDFKGFVYGEDPYGDGNNVWFVGKYSNTFAWSGSFEDRSTNGLDDITSAPGVDPGYQPAPAYDFELDIPSFVREDGVVITVEKSPAFISNLEVGAGNVSPDRSVIHQFGTLGRDTFESTDSQFKSEVAKVSAYHSVSGRRVRQHVSLKDRAYHAASVGNNWYGMETDPAQDPETILTARGLQMAVNRFYNKKLEPILHKNVPKCATRCGDAIDLAKYDVPFPGPAEPTPESLEQIVQGLIEKFTSDIMSAIKEGKK